ncbi:MAG: MBL fold metallo-hydrolase [Anaerolineales bacterium]
MAKLIVLGTASAVPTLHHENTHFVLKGETESVLVDCVGGDIYRLERAGVNLGHLNNIILTHCHPDHISGIPSLLMSLWLIGRTTPLNLHGLAHTLNCIEKMMELYEWHTWPRFFPVNFHRLPEGEMVPVLETADFRIFASPVCHIIPTIGLRIEAQSSGKVLAYSCDTEPCMQVVGLGKGVDILIHESSGKSYGHSSAAQAGEIAQKAGAKALYLIHYPPNRYQDPGMIAQAKTHFQGEIRFAEDLMELSF